MRRSIRIRSAVGLTVLIAVCAITAPAKASHVSPASLGHYVDPGDETCFREGWGAMRNDNCLTMRRFMIPIHTYWAGTQCATVSVTAPDETHPVGCQLITAHDGAHYHIGALAWTPGGGTHHLSVSASFASNQPGWVLCYVYPGARVNHVWFSGS